VIGAQFTSAHSRGQNCSQGWIASARLEK
jgi:hypothetical protein